MFTPIRLHLLELNGKLIIYINLYEIFEEFFFSSNETIVSRRIGVKKSEGHLELSLVGEKNDDDKWDDLVE